MTLLHILRTRSRAELSGEGPLQQSTATRRLSPTYLIVAVLVAVLIWVRWGGIRKGIWIDLDVYIRGAAAVVRHEQLYDVSVQGQPFTYPPFAALLFVPLELLGNVGARWVLTVASIGCYILILVLCARRLHMSPAAAALVGLAGLAFEPFARNILLGQINLVLMALVVVDCFVVPARYRGLLVGIAAGIKIVPGAFILFLLLKREWGAALRCVTAFGVTVGLGALFVPGDSWQFWSGGFIDLPRFGADAILRGDNQSLTGAVMRLSHDPLPPAVLSLTLSVAVMALGVVAAKRQVRVGNDVTAVVCIGFASLLASPVSWTHHWVWSVIAFLVLLHGGRRVAAALIGAIFMIGPMWFTPRGNLLELTHSWLQAAACVSYVVVGLTFLTFFASRPRPGHRSSQSPT